MMSPQMDNESMITDSEYHEIRGAVLEEVRAEMTMQDYFDAVFAQPEIEKQLLAELHNEHESLTIKNLRIGRFLVIASENFIEQIAKPRIEERLNEREQELRRGVK